MVSCARGGANLRTLGAVGKFEIPDTIPKAPSGSRRATHRVFKMAAKKTNHVMLKVSCIRGLHYFEILIGREV